jgi:hypothetical protein
MQAVAVAMKSDLPRSMLWCTVYCSSAAGIAGAQRAAHHLEAFLAGGGPALTGSHGCSGGGNAAGGKGLREGPRADLVGEAEESDPEEDATLDPDEYLVPPPMTRHWRPLVTYAVMPELPRG